MALRLGLTKGFSGFERSGLSMSGFCGIREGCYESSSHIWGVLEVKVPCRSLPI